MRAALSGRREKSGFEVSRNDELINVLDGCSFGPIA
jgi:hypothetical protein